MKRGVFYFRFENVLFGLQPPSPSAEELRRAVVCVSVCLCAGLWLLQVLVWSKGFTSGPALIFLGVPEYPLSVIVETNLKVLRFI